jgi:hypothetical protein
LYGGVIPVIKSLTSQSVNIGIGEEATAEVIVVSRSDDQPLAGIKVTWAYPGLSLSTTTTDANGISKLFFTPNEIGTHELTASVGFGAGSALDFNVYERGELADLKLSNLLVYLGGIVIADVRVLKEKPEGTLVVWSYPGMEPSTSMADAEGWASCNFKPTKFPVGGFAELKATIDLWAGDGRSIATNVWVTSNGDDNDIVTGSILYFNKTPMLIPNFPVPSVKQHKENDVGLLMKSDSNLKGHQFSISSSRNDITFVPAAGTLVTIDESFAWKMTASAPVGTRFAIAIGSPSFNGNLGFTSHVVAPEDVPDDPVAHENQN